MLCPECNDVLPEGVKACRSCVLPVRVVSPPQEDRKSALSNKNVGKIGTFFLLLFIIVGLIALFSNNSVQQYLRDRIGTVQERSLTEGKFHLKSSEFVSYKIVVPAGATDVSVNGSFKAISTPAKKNSGGEEGDGVEVYLLTDATFVVWRNGYSAGSEYESGRLAEGQIHAQLPDGGAIYYLVFSNRFSHQSAKSVQANVSLRYKSWLPEYLFTLKDRFENLLGL